MVCMEKRPHVVSCCYSMPIARVPRLVPVHSINRALFLLSTVLVLTISDLGILPRPIL